MELTVQTILGVISLSSGGVLVVGGWVMSVEKRINGLKALQKTIDKVDLRTERMSVRAFGRDIGIGEVDE